MRAAAADVPGARNETGGPLPGHDLIVIGGSAGAVEALSALAAGLPPDLPAAVCVVVHQPPYAHSRLAEILDRSGPLPAANARDGAPLLPGTIHVAVPDRHLLVVPGAPGGAGMLRLAHGPRENRSRPAIDPLFRSAALAYGPRVIAVVVSGALDDGTAGLWAVRDRGGLAVVQDPGSAGVSSMPESALREVGADHVAAAAELGPLLGRLARLPAPDGAAAEAEAGASRLEALEREVALAAIGEAAHQQSARNGLPSRFSCPECTGVLWDASTEGGPLRFRCDTGHAYSPATLADAQVESVENALWASLRALENSVELGRVRAQGARQRGMEALAERYTAEWEAAQQHAGVLRELLRLDGRSPPFLRDERGAWPPEG
jgi:two-component system, chemotaxis family, protein-glutamate methylesterase/glutaminase